jgi:hypothetical protein
MFKHALRKRGYNSAERAIIPSELVTCRLCCPDLCRGISLELGARQCSLLTFINHSFASRDPEHGRFKIPTQLFLGVSTAIGNLRVGLGTAVLVRHLADFATLYFIPCTPCTTMNIPFMYPQSQFPHSCVSERFIYSIPMIGPHISCNRIGRSILYLNRSQTHECGNWDCGQASPCLGICVSNVRHWFFAVYILQLHYINHA